MNDVAQSLRDEHPIAFRIIEAESGEREVAELDGYLDRGEFMPVWEIASKHGHIQAGWHERQRLRCPLCARRGRERPGDSDCLVGSGWSRADGTEEADDLTARRRRGTTSTTPIQGEAHDRQ